MNRDIAIIGIAGRFPDAENLDALFKNLKEGRDSVRPITEKRIKETTLDPARQTIPCGYLDDIDKFDHQFFDISLGEAQTMGPNQRLLLTTAHEAIENAGYNPDDLRGSDTCVYVSQCDSLYYQHAEETVPTLISGNSPDFLAPRISRQFGLTGTATMVDTACSSSFTALNLACNELLLEQAQMAILGGVNLHIFPYKNSAQGILDVWAKDGKSRAFSARASGMSAGEMAACILLKPLATAIRDRDPIRAVIKSVAVNNNADQASSPSAPDGASQAKVILAAWKKAGINPEGIRFIEAHGSGTQLGDSLEVEGINKAFKTFTKTTRFCALSTIKSNVGHGKSSAGMSGLIKAVLSVEKKMLFPTIHFDEPNPLIDFDRSAVYVHDKLSAWEEEEGRPRLAGVHSFGLSGVNTHVVLANGPSEPPRTPDSGPYLMTLSSKSRDGLLRNIRALHDRLVGEPPLRPEDVSFTLNCGRKHQPFRFACVVENLESLKGQLSRASQMDSADFIGTGAPKRSIFVFSDHEVSQADLDSYMGKYPVFAKAYLKCAAEGNPGHPQFRDFAFQYSFYELLASHQITTTDFLSTGVGKLVSAVVDGSKSLPGAIAEAEQHKKAPVEHLNQRMTALIEREAKKGATAFLAMGPQCPLCEEIGRQTSKRNDVLALSPNRGAEDEDGYKNWLRFLYLANVPLPWNQIHQGGQGRRIALPTYQFAKTRCWLRETPKREDTGTASTEGAPRDATTYLKESGTPIEIRIAKAWAEVLDQEQFSNQDDFFDLGGDSLKATRMITALNQDLAIELNFEDVFDFSSIATMARYIDGLWSSEEKIAKIWEDVLKKKGIGAEDDFFKLGGHSLLANQVLMRIDLYFDLKLNFEDIFKYPTLKDLAQRVDHLLSIAEAPALPNDIPLAQPSQFYGVSPSQKRLWVLSQMGDASVAYNLPVFDLLEGPLNRAALEGALVEMIVRHESLRTVFTTQGGEPRQKILNQGQLGFQPEFKDLRTEPDPHSEARRIITEDATQPFSLSQGPLLKAKILQIADEKHVFSLTIHHIIADDWSVKVFLKELLVLYNATAQGEPSPLAPLPIQYKDYAAWMDQQMATPSFSDSEAYWLQRLGSDRPRLLLPTDRPRPAVQTFNGRVLDMHLNRERTAKLESFCQHQGATLFMGLVTAINALFFKYTQQTDIILGSPLAGRWHPNLEGQIGFYANTLILRNRFDAHQTLETLLKGVKQCVIEANQHQMVPFDRLVDRLKPERDLSRSVLFDCMVVLQNSTVDVGEGFGGQGLTVASFQTEHTLSKLDLTLEFSKIHDGLQGKFEYNSDLFDEDRIKAMATHFQAIVDCLVDCPTENLNRIEYLGEKERTRLLETLNHTATQDEKWLVNRRILELAGKYPTRPAIYDGSVAYRYEELVQQITTLAQCLMEHGVGPETPVGLWVERECHLVVGMLAIMAAGGCYLPLDPAAPTERTSYILDDAGARLVLTDRQTAACVPKNCETLRLDSNLGHHQNPDLPVISPNRLAYVMYTSGSTGNPKGVPVSHSALTNLLEAMASLTGLGHQDVFLAVTTIAFDIASLEIFLPLVTGGKLILADRKSTGDGAALVELIESHAVSAMQATPATWQMMPDSWWQKPSSLKILCGGEGLPASLAQRILEKTDTAWNVYGPTETTIWSTALPLRQDSLPPGNGLMPIGTPIHNTQVYILDAWGQSVPMGIPGDLYIGGRGLGRGYHQRPHLSATHFVPNPFSETPGERLYRTGDVARYRFDGTLEFLDRSDNQVKIRGFRIEPGEVEHALADHPQIREVAVVARQDTRGTSLAQENGHGNKHRPWRLIAYLVGNSSGNENRLTTSELTRYLKTKLPEYMVPSAFVNLEAMPLTSNGKIDRKGLPDPEGERPEFDHDYVKPKSQLERQISDIWKNLLEVERVGTNDNYFELGGDSLLLIRTMDQMNQKLGSALTLIEMFQYPTIESLSDYLTNRQGQVSSLAETQARVQVRRDARTAMNRRQKMRREAAGQLG